MVPLQVDFAVLWARHEKSPNLGRLYRGHYCTLYTENISQFIALQVDEVEVRPV